MTQHDLEALLAPLGDDAPSGPDLEYDPEFMALERDAAPKAERAIGDAVKAAEEPDWSRVADTAQQLLGRSKDLRIAMHLVTAWTRTSGLAGWADGLRLVQGLLENFWDTVHPQLDAEDDDDPTMRVNSVVPLGDLQGALRYFRSTPFVQSPRLGRYTLRDLRIANETLKVSANDSDTPAPTMTDIEACCMDCAEEELADAVAAVNASFDCAKAIDGIFNDRVGTAGPELKVLLSDIYELKKFLEPQLARRVPQDGGEGGEAAGEAAAEGTGAVAAAPGKITGPQDVIRRIDELCEYYARSEPSSPVPLLLRRAQRLVGKDFSELLQDLAPSGVSELQVIAGSTDEE